MELILIIQVVIWALGGWCTGLILGRAGLRLSSGQLFLMLLGWGFAGVIALIGWSALTGQMYYYHFGGTILYGLGCGMLGGFVTIRQAAKARRGRRKA